MIKKPPKFYIRATDAGKLLGYSRKRIVRMIERGELKGRRAKGVNGQGNRWQILYSDVIDYLTNTTK